MLAISKKLDDKCPISWLYLVHQAGPDKMRSTRRWQASWCRPQFNSIISRQKHDHTENEETHRPSCLCIYFWSPPSRSTYCFGTLSFNNHYWGCLYALGTVDFKSGAVVSVHSFIKGIYRLPGRSCQNIVPRIESTVSRISSAFYFFSLNTTARLKRCPFYFCI